MDKAKKLLLVEDDPITAMDFEMSLSDHGWDVVGPAATSKAAFELIDAGLPDIAVLDFNIRGGTTEEFARHLVGKAVPVVFLSGDDTTTQIEELASCPVVSKPVSVAKLQLTLLEISKRNYLAMRVK